MTRVRMKLAAGDTYIYPTTCRHRVAPVIGGTRLVAVFNLLRLWWRT